MLFEWWLSLFTRAAMRGPKCSIWIQVYANVWLEVWFSAHAGGR